MNISWKLVILIPFQPYLNLLIHAVHYTAEELGGQNRKSLYQQDFLEDSSGNIAFITDNAAC